VDHEDGQEGHGEWQPLEDSQGIFHGVDPLLQGPGEGGGENSEKKEQNRETMAVPWGLNILWRMLKSFQKIAPLLLIPVISRLRIEDYGLRIKNKQPIFIFNSQFSIFNPQCSIN
jgi:hypothetical protein